MLTASRRSTFSLKAGMPSTTCGMFVCARVLINRCRHAEHHSAAGVNKKPLVAIIHNCKALWVSVLMASIDPSHAVPAALSRQGPVARISVEH